MMRILITLLGAAIFLGAMLFPVSALASSNAAPDSSGEGASKISGWSISNIHYELSNDPSFISGVTFDLDAPAGRVAIKLISSETTFYPCTNAGALHWDCRVQGVTLSSMDDFRVIAVGN